MINIFDLIEIVYSIFMWAWRWQLPIAGLTIYPVQLGLCCLVIEIAEYFMFPIGCDDLDDDDDD